MEVILKTLNILDIECIWTLSKAYGCNNDQIDYQVLSNL